MNQAFACYQSPAPVLDRDRLIRSHLPLVDFLTSRMVAQVPHYMTRDDIASAAVLGLVDAAQRFDPAKGVQFKTFAEQRIRGSIIDEARKMDAFSRTLRAKQSRIEDAVARLEGRLGRTPEEVEIAAALGCSLEQYRRQLQEVSHLGMVSLNKTFGREGTAGVELQEMIEDKSIPGPHEQAEGKALAREIARHLRGLSEKEQLVVSLYYYEELSQKEIARLLDLTEGRISQLHSQALIKLRAKMRRQRD
ncbi:MAG: FliA/WhiG family RNA polymerase sigma factor [Desulfobacterales bacterium]|nr:FliA/WhiG family RNA polymerase sigma factor [Desulfobacterales bacterium]